MTIFKFLKNRDDCVILILQANQRFLSLVLLYIIPIFAFFNNITSTILKNRNACIVCTYTIMYNSITIYYNPYSNGKISICNAIVFHKCQLSAIVFMKLKTC